MNTFLIHLKQLDWLLITAALFLVAFGLLSIYSSSINTGDFSLLKKQIIFFAIGLFLMFLFSAYDWHGLREPRLILGLYFITLAGLFFLFFLAPEIRGVKGWYRIGPVNIDPIEPLKIILIIMLAKYFSSRHIEMYRLRHILISGFYVLAPCVLIFLQPDLGSVLILISFWLGMLVLSGIKLRHFLILILCFLIIFVFSWHFLLLPYQKARLLSFVEPIDPLGVSWSQNQAKIAIGSGGLLGKGITQGTQAIYGFLPEPKTDFIFAALIEETGLLGMAILLCLFLVLLWRIIKIGALTANNFCRLFCSGLAILFVSQVFIHIGMNIGLLPIIGISLPLISYGGSGLIMSFIGLGIVMSMRVH